MMAQLRMASVSNMKQCNISNSLHKYSYEFNFNRRACAIADPENEEVIVTGGYHTLTKVSIYNKNGHQRDLPDLSKGRSEHACSSFIYDQIKVSKITNKCEIKVSTSLHYHFNYFIRF